MSLLKSFQDVLLSFGLKEITHPLFYNSKIAIRFNIGDNGNDVYIVSNNDDSIVNPGYVDACLTRVRQIFSRLKSLPDILVIDGCICENETVDQYISLIMAAAGLYEPDEIKCERINEDETILTHIVLCWKLDHYNPDRLFREIILADLGGGNHFLTSSVYFVCTDDHVLFHLYDDQGADLIADKKETICHIYEDMNHYILDHDRERIDAIFKT